DPGPSTQDQELCMTSSSTTHHASASGSPFRQPRAVWAVAFACVVSFMGIGLVDPILPALSHQLNATPSQVSLPFTSYLAVTAASATGVFAGAIILYETALGLGIAIGPLLGGELGSLSWRGPFFGVAVLMTISLIATALFVPSLPKPAHPTSVLAPIKAL